MSDGHKSAWGGKVQNSGRVIGMFLKIYEFLLEKKKC